VKTAPARYRLHKIAVNKRKGYTMTHTEQQADFFAGQNKTLECLEGHPHAATLFYFGAEDAKPEDAAPPWKWVYASDMDAWLLKIGNGTIGFIFHKSNPLIKSALADPTEALEWIATVAGDFLIGNDPHSSLNRPTLYTMHSLEVLAKSVENEAIKRIYGKQPTAGQGH